MPISPRPKLPTFNPEAVPRLAQARRPSALNRNPKSRSRNPRTFGIGKGGVAQGWQWGSEGGVVNEAG